MGASFRREVKVRDDMRRRGFNCYVPMRYEVRNIRGRTDRRLVPAVHELLFVYSTKTEITAYKQGTEGTLYFKTTGRKGHRELMVVADAEMENFMRLTQHVEEHLTYFRPDEIKLRVGSRIKVHGGVFDGVEGVLMKVPGKRNRQLVVSLTGVATVAVNMSPEVVEVLDEPVGKSNDVEGDTKRLYQLAQQRLFAPPDRETQESEYNVMIAELRRLLPTVSLHRGYTAAREAEIALAVYMGTKALKQPAEMASERLINAINSLKTTSMLRLRLQACYAYLAPDDEQKSAIAEKVRQWKKAPLSEQQRKFIEELKIMKAEN